MSLFQLEPPELTAEAAWTLAVLGRKLSKAFFDCGKQSRQTMTLVVRNQERLMGDQTTDSHSLGQSFPTRAKQGSSIRIDIGLLGRWYLFGLVKL